MNSLTSGWANKPYVAAKSRPGIENGKKVATEPPWVVVIPVAVVKRIIFRATTYFQQSCCGAEKHGVARQNRRVADILSHHCLAQTVAAHFAVGKRSYL